MSDKQIRKCLESVISTIERTKEKLQIPRGRHSSVLVSTDTNVHTFTLDKDEEETMERLKMKLERILWDFLSILPDNSRKYLLELVYPYSYHPKEKRFGKSFNLGMIETILKDFQRLLDSLDAFQAAWDGNEHIVRKFLSKYPSNKDTPGPFGTTLLYSAARNNRFELVQYLISSARCSVNAQNQQHLEKALASSDITADDFTTAPTAASTALHAACFNGHIEVVEYLVHYGADYFLENHAKETPIENAFNQTQILEFFQDHLVLSYFKKTSKFPHQTILKQIEEDTGYRNDCVWEYKSLEDATWHSYSSSEANQLQKSLIAKAGETFSLDVHLKISSELSKVSLMQFLQTGKSRGSGANLSWVRCRGSSLLNFRCYSTWQMMFTKHPKSVHSSSSLKTFPIPTSYDSRFEIRLNNWYHCPPKLNEDFDRAMDYLQRYLKFKLDYISNEELTFNLKDFRFTNKDKTVMGFLRWIPKMISNNLKHRDQIVPIDNYHTLSNFDPIPLTFERLKQRSKSKKQTSAISDEKFDEDLNEDETINNNYQNNGLDDDEEEDDQDIPNKRFSRDSVKWSIDELRNVSPLNTNNERDGSQSRSSSPSLNELQIDDYLSPNAVKGRPQQKISSFVKSQPSDNDQAIEAMREKFEREKRDLQIRLKEERLKLDEQTNLNIKRGVQQDQKFLELKQRLEEMQRQQEKFQARDIKLQQIVSSIQTFEFEKVQIEVVNDFLTPKFVSIQQELRKENRQLDNYFAEQIPKISFQSKNHSYTVVITGFRSHHDVFKGILQRIWNLLNCNQSTKDYYQNYLNRFVKELTTKTFREVQSKTRNWKQYSKFFLELLEEKQKEYLKLFDQFIHGKCQELTDQTIEGTLTSPENHLKKHTNQFLKEHDFLNEIESIKQKAFETFIKENIRTQNHQTQSKPTKKSLSVLLEFVDNIQKILQTDSRYIGCKSEHFNLISDLLERLMIYHSSFILQLPLYESAKELLEKIEKNSVITIATSTGSGKSTLLPALLVAQGYDKILVTQPRRLPCNLISTRVNQTMTNENDPTAKKLAGWAVSGVEKNPNAKILYLTDGLLKERLLYDEHFIDEHTRLDKSIIFFIDEVHERSINIDLCLALLARLFTLKPQLKSKMKVIISSATLDTSVPKLFKEIPQIQFAEFVMPQMGTIYPVEKIDRSKVNLIALIQEICKKRRRHDQILCFVSSVADVHQGVRALAEISDGAIVAHPLTQSQHPDEQRKCLEDGTIFFSTTVAETSLTFPSLKYVIDTGMINMPIFDFQTRRTILSEVQAAHSTIKQRLGRLGRTQPGQYYSLYDFKPEDKPFPTPQICQSELNNLEFSLRKSPLKKGFSYLKQFLPDRPSTESLDATIQELKELDIVDQKSSDQLTEHGEALTRLPDFGSLSMSKAVYSALCHQKCGRDLICLSAMLGVLNTTTIFQSIPQVMKSTDGDFMTLINVMDQILLVKQSVSSQKFDLDRVCQAKELTKIKHVIRQALRRYTNLEKIFSLSDDYREQAQIKSGKWESIAKALLFGYPSNVFVSMIELQGRRHRYARYNDKKDFAVLDPQSTLRRKISAAPVSLVLAKDIRHSTAVRAIAVLSFVGEIKSSWLDYPIERIVCLTSEEEKHLNENQRFNDAQTLFSKRVSMKLNTGTIVLKGPSGVVLDAELHLHQQMVTETKFTLLNNAKPKTAEYINLERNLETIMKVNYIFNPMIWRWAAQEQVQITINSNTATKTSEITVKGRGSQSIRVKAEFNSFLYWLGQCAVVRHPSSGVPPRLLRPATRKNCLDIEERISRVTDSKRTFSSLLNSVKGAEVSRETRMEAVAWIAVCRFDCKLEGGFVRDWIVAHSTSRPAHLLSDPKKWIELDPKSSIPGLHKEVVPTDLDCHLPSNSYFDIDKFQDELHKVDIKCEVSRQEWRYILLLDRDAPTGPFTMDLIEPHVALTHDRIDFDVSNLSVEKDYTRELGMRIDIQQKPYFIELETIVENIKKKTFQVLRPIDRFVKDRIDKMVNVRKWTQHGEPFSIVPNPHFRYHVVLIPLPKDATLYSAITDQMKQIAPPISILSIEQVKNPLLEDSYEAMKKIIAKQCPGANPNERELFHGTNGLAINGIVEDGFDDRYYSKEGYWGHGAYFADDPKKSDVYTKLHPDDQTKTMFYNKVLLGNISVQSLQDKTLVSAPHGFHSVQGTEFQYVEYIVYRFGQALPYLKITYKINQH